jgi:hypothetical protein
MIIVYCAADPGTTLRGSAVLRIATSLPPTVASTFSVFGLFALLRGLCSPFSLFTLLPSYPLTLFAFSPSRPARSIFLIEEGHDKIEIEVIEKN